MPSSDPASLQDLRYPPVRVNHSLTKLDLNTLMMRSTTRRQPEEPGSSLDESTYELLSDSLLDTSDDEAHTESIASTNGPTPDDTSDFSDDDNDYEITHTDTHDGFDPSHLTNLEQQPDVHPTVSGDESTLTEGPVPLEASESWMIRLEEHSTQQLDVMLGSKVIKSLPDQTGELPQVLSQYGSAHVRLVVRAALSQRSAPTPDAYKIMYIGKPEKWLEDVVTSQIGAALTASPSISKSVMVRGQIEPYGPVIHVYRCAEIHTFAQRDKTSHVLVILDDGQQIKFGPGLVLDSSDRPDLVVFCHPTVSGTLDDANEYLSASEVFDRENIPFIDLAQARPYGEGASTYDSKSLRVCMEGRDDANAEYELKEVLPIDYYTFSQLEPSQLNRHLAFISPHLLSSRDMDNCQRPRSSWLGGSRKALTKKLGRSMCSKKVLIPLVFLFMALSAFLQNTAFGPSAFQQALLSRFEPSIPSQAPVLSTPTSSALSTSQLTTSVASVSSGVNVKRDLTLVPPRGKPSSRRPEGKGGKMGGFNIRATGNHQFVLSPSKDFSSCRRKPQLRILVSRNSQAVPARFNRTLSGDYIVDLEREYTISNFNVSITTHSKPLLRQSFEIRLGNDKSRIAQLLDTAKTNLVNTQEYLRNRSGTAAQLVRASLKDLEVASMHWRHEAEGSKQEVVEHVRVAQQVLQRQVAVGVDMLKQIPGATWTGIRQVTAPIRTSSPMLRARMNALRLRCGMEVAAGVSGRSPDEKQSWACSKVSQGEDHHRVL